MSSNRPDHPGDKSNAPSSRRIIGLIRDTWWARLVFLGALTALIGVLPVPWLVAQVPDPPGMAWKLDGRLQFNGKTIDPPGSWVGLTAGRPPLVAEVVRGWLDGEADRPRDMRKGSTFGSPAMAEPAAIAIGLLEAGMDVPVTIVVEARDPLVDGLPTRIAIARLNGQPIYTREDWATSIETLEVSNEIVTTDGRVFAFAGDVFPYRTIAMMQTPTDIEVSLAGIWGHVIPAGWYRSLRLGRSHGLLLALAAYSDVSGADLAKGRVIGATGVIRGNGAIGAVGGLSAKARAALRAGVDVLVYPAAQRCQGIAAMKSLGSTSMTMVPVATLSDAIEALRGEADIAVSAPGACDA